MSNEKIKYRYSGKLSKMFWKVIDELPDNENSEMYSLGVALQNLEEQVLNRLSVLKENSVNKKH